MKVSRSGRTRRMEEDADEREEDDGGGGEGKVYSIKAIIENCRRTDAQKFPVIDSLLLPSFWNTRR